VDVGDVVGLDSARRRQRSGSRWSFSWKTAAAATLRHGRSETPSLAADVEDGDGRGPAEQDGSDCGIGDDSAAEAADLAGEGVHDGCGVGGGTCTVAGQRGAEDSPSRRSWEVDLLLYHAPQDEGRVALEATAASTFCGKGGQCADVLGQRSLRIARSRTVRSSAICDGET
jgi:hypothetical protein